MRKNPPAKWVLPLVVNPTTSTEWCVPVPDDPFHRAAFLGALASLGSAYKWQDDPDHTAKDVAKVWQDIADNLERCMSGPTTVIAEEWEDTLAICESLRWNNGVLEGFCCGEWVPIESIGDGAIPGGQTQPSTGSRPAEGTSKCYSRLLTARDVYLVPFGVQNGDIVTVSARSGAWSNDGVRWTCTDGTPFALGACSGERYHDVADPDPTTLFHGQLMLDVGGQLLSATDGAVTLSGLSGQQQLTIRPNFEPGTFAGGTVQFTVCVENGSAPPEEEWCMFLSFVSSDYGWVASPTQGQYTPGVGFENDGVAPYPDICEPHRAFSPDVELTYVKMYFTVDVASSGVGSSCAIYTNHGQWVRDDTLVDSTGAKTIESSDAGLTVNDLFITTAGVNLEIRITGFEVHGIGTNPFGSSNC